MKLDVAAVQLSSGSDVSHNLEEAVQLVNVAADRGASTSSYPSTSTSSVPSRDLPTLLNRSRGQPPFEWPSSPGHAP